VYRLISRIVLFLIDVSIVALVVWIMLTSFRSNETQLTFGPDGHILTNVNVWSPDSQWIVYDVRSDPAGSVFDGTRIERVHVQTKQVEVLYESKNQSCCGVVTHHPQEDRIVFIHGPENPTPDWSYNAYHRRGVLLNANHPQTIENLDACNLNPPFTAGALRGGSHIHTFSPDGQWVAFTYEDHLLAQFPKPGNDHDLNQRNIGISVPLGPITVKKDHPRNHDGSYYSVLVTRTVSEPKPGSDEISRAFEESWIGNNGYVKPDGTRQNRAIAFQGNVVTSTGETISEVFVVDITDEVTIPGDGPLEGTLTRRPLPPKGTIQRRITYTSDHKFPGIQGPRHWLRSSPDGTRIAFLMKNEEGIVQLWTVSPTGGLPEQLTHNPYSISSAFTWSSDGRWIAHSMDNSIFVTDTASGKTIRLTERFNDDEAPRPEACVFSPDGKQIAYIRPIDSSPGRYNQVFMVTMETD
jgi:Tol biopolymer transport system component